MSALRKHLRKISALLAALSLLLLCACGAEQPQPSQSPLVQAKMNNQPNYYKLYTFDGSRLVYSNQPVYAGDGGKYEAVARALMERDAILRDDYKGIFSRGISLRSIRRQGDVLYINFSDELRYEQPAVIAQILSCLANTFTSFEEINYISVGCEGKQLVIPGYEAHPVMALDGEADDPQALLTNWKGAQSAYELAGEYKEKVYALLYFRAASGGFYVPEAREIIFDGTDYADQLINQLLRGPAQDGYAVFEEMMSLFKPSVFDGQTLSVSFLARGGYPAQEQLWNAIPALALTLKHLYPDMRSIAVEINIQTEEGYDTVYSYSSELSSFLGLIRTNVRCYYPNEDYSGLRARTIPVKAYDELTVSRELLKSILEGSAGGMEEIGDLLSYQEEISYEEAVLDVYQTGNCLNINFSRSFHDALRMLSYKQERFLVYAIVNTLCENSGLTEVRFLADGAQVETFGRYISALRPLMPDYGMLVS